MEDIKEEPKKPKKDTPPPERRRDYPKPLSHKEPSSQTEPGRPAIFPPDRIQTFVPMEDIKEESEKPSKSKKNPGYRNPFIPPAT
jgi:hypothetical protein